MVGPLRPQLTLGPVQRNAAAAEVFDPQAGPRARAEAAAAVRDGFLDWYLLGGARADRVHPGRRGRRDRAAHPAGAAPAEPRDRRAPAAAGDLVALRAGGPADDRGRGGRVRAGLARRRGRWPTPGRRRGWATSSSLSQLVGAYHLTPDPVGPPVTGYDGAVIGDSRAVRVGGPPLPGGSADDLACERSTDSLAAEIGDLLPARVLNLACPSATVTSGLRGPQERAGRLLPAQVGLLKQVQGLRFVVLAIGPNDVGWTDFLRYCYGVADCSDQLTQGEFDYRLAAFDRVYGDLLIDLNDLPGRPQVIVMTSYGAFGSDADCADTRAAGYPGLDPAKIGLLTARNDQLNAVLTRRGREVRLRGGPARARAALRSAAATGWAPTCRAWPTRTRSTPPGSARCGWPRRWSG